MHFTQFRSITSWKTIEYHNQYVDVNKFHLSQSDFIFTYTHLCALILGLCSFVPIYTITINTEQFHEHKDP